MDGKRAAPRKGRRVVFLGGYAPVGRDPCVPPPGTHFSAGHAGPALRDGMLNRVSRTASPTFPRAMHAASALSYTGAGEGYTVRRCGGGSWFLGICALGLGLGILIAAVFPVGCLMFLVAFLLIACGVACLRDRR